MFHGLRKIVMFFLGPSSKAGTFIQEELDLDDKSYLQFMSTYCIQAAYRASVHQLFDESSLLKDSLKIAQEDYMQIWRKMAEKKRMTAIQITQTNRRDSPLW